MTCVLLGGIRQGDIRHDVSGGDITATPILDWGHDDVARLYEDIAEGAIQSAQEFLVSAHRSVAEIFGRCTASTTGNPSR